MPVCLSAQSNRIYGILGANAGGVCSTMVLEYAIAERGKRGWIGWYDSTYCCASTGSCIVYQSFSVFSVF